MADSNDKEVARLERLNEELKQSLRRCRDLLHDYEVRLAANSNELGSLGDEQNEQKASDRN